MIHLSKVSINPTAIASIEWAEEKQEEVPAEGATELSNPHAGVEAIPVVIIKLIAIQGELPLAYPISVDSPDYKLLKEAVGRR
jgi:hypothetical protein